MTSSEFCRSIISDTGGFDSWTEHEVLAVDPGTVEERIAVAQWTLRCLANPDCEGSAEALGAILERRGEILLGKEEAKNR